MELRRLASPLPLQLYRCELNRWTQKHDAYRTDVYRSTPAQYLHNRTGTQKQLISVRMALLPIATEDGNGRSDRETLSNLELRLSSTRRLKFSAAQRRSHAPNGLPSMVDLGLNIWRDRLQWSLAAFTNVQDPSLYTGCFPEQIRLTPPLPIRCSVPLPFRSGQLAPSHLLRGMIRTVTPEKTPNVTVFFKAEPSTRPPE